MAARRSTSRASASATRSAHRRRLQPTDGGHLRRASTSCITAAPARRVEATSVSSGRCATSRSTSRRARCSASSAATAPASRRCSRSCPASPSRPRAAPTIRGRVGVAARGRHRLPPGADRAREHLPERRDPRHDARARSRASSTRSSSSPGSRRFIDTPVKRYSSGMYVRLAFAVAAHLEPEILLVDEVLASATRRSSSGASAAWMRSRAAAARSSSSATTSPSVASLCTRGASDRAGPGDRDGPVEDVLAQYVEMVRDEGETDLRERQDRQGDGRLRFTGVRITGPSGAPRTWDDTGLTLLRSARRLARRTGDLLRRRRARGAGVPCDESPRRP